jgi:hypothetical protein
MNIMASFLQTLFNILHPATPSDPGFSMYSYIRKSKVPEHKETAASPEVGVTGDDNSLIGRNTVISQRPEHLLGRSEPGMLYIKGPDRYID